MLEGQLELFTAREFKDAQEQKEFARGKLKQVTKYLEGQGVPPLFAAHALFELQIEINNKGKEELRIKA